MHYLLDQFDELESLSISCSSEENIPTLEESIQFGESSSDSNIKKRGTIEIMSTKLLSALDKCKISDRDAIHIIISTAEAIGQDISKLKINRSTLQRKRAMFRKTRAKELKINLNVLKLDYVVLHWDGKLLPDLCEKVKVDRLPIVISFEGITQLLGVPKLLSGTGVNQAKAIFESLEEWSIIDKVQAVCCDTTASNTGRINGTCVLLEQFIDRDLLYLPCRHHIFELLLKSVFDLKLKLPTTGPDVPIFKRFQQQWPTFNTQNYYIGLNNTVVKSLVENKKDLIIEFCNKELKERQCREDYRELLELTVIFLGAIPPRGITFRYPGAFHHARWMSKAIYSFKIFMFQNQFQCQAKEINAFRDICIFLINIYVRTWFRAPFAIEAPLNDYNLLKSLVKYPDSDISRVTINKLCGHLWYIAPETMALAFFDSRIPKDTKLKMINATISADEMEDIKTKKINIRSSEVKEFVKKDFVDLVSPETLNFFSRFSISTEFFNVDPDTWETREDYQKGLKTVKNLMVVNDVAERNVKLIEEYNTILTKDEDQKQYLLQVVNEYRKKYPDSKKSTLSLI